MNTRIDSNSTWKRTWRIAAAGMSVAAFAMLAACGSDPAAATASGQDAGSPQQGGTVTLVTDPDSLQCVDPFQTAWTQSRTIVRNYVDSLVDQDPKTGEIKPWLAKSWTISDDGKTYTFTLKDGVTFSDGSKFDADAVVDTFTENLATLKEKPGTVGGFYVQNLTGVSKVDDHTVKFELSAPNASFLQGLATPTLGIISRASAKLTPQQRCDGQVVGTGPFTIEKYDAKSGLTLKKRTGYTSSSPLAAHQGDAYLDSIVISYVSESSVRLGNLAAGTADVVWSGSDKPLVSNELSQIKQVGGTVESRPLPGATFGLFPNVRNGGILSDNDVRQALSLSIDRATYAKTVFRDGYPNVKGVISSTTPGFKAEPSSVEFDKAKAAKLLDAAGWKKGDDGYRYKDGKKLTVTFLTSTKDDGYELLQDELKQTGFDFQIKVVTSAQYTTLTNANKYDLVSLTYTRADQSAINTLLDERYATFKAISGNTQDADTQATIEAAFDKGTSATDTKERTSIYEGVQDTISKQNVIIPVYERSQDVALSSKVHGLRFTAESFGDFHDLWKAQ
ncbi:ABC transporter substrate-binding protein [Bifidobacterium aesculapii]|uniref:ABC transporter substrate-binding protein n=1 Tax=Bifidobacterium aesculapii TaxID=1329411 RepID=UPI0006E273EE|nr:ABC transporter substrate-binding protein [Bifidobacterium aesculapii]